MTTVDTGKALLAAVLAEPQSDDPRLVYADWLEEHGNDAERHLSAFIRCQLALAKMRREGHPCADPNEGYPCIGSWGKRCEVCRLRYEEYALLNRQSLESEVVEVNWTYAHEWMWPITKLGFDPKQLDFRRGFVGAMTCSFNSPDMNYYFAPVTWCQFADKITSQFPIEEVTLTTWPACQMRGDPALDDFMEYRLLAGDHHAAIKIPMDELYTFRGDYNEMVTRRLLKTLWPKIRFNLPKKATMS